MFPTCGELRGVAQLPSSRIVLVVDGDREVAAMFRRAARDLRLEVAHSATADEAWERLLILRPLAVFTDYRLIGFDGISLLERVAQHLPSAKRILHTSERVVGSGQGLDIPVLGKPCDEASLTELLRSLVSGEAGTAPQATPG
jgi:CheY-like chemotaxis protein